MYLFLLLQDLQQRRWRTTRQKKNDLRFDRQLFISYLRVSERSEQLQETFHNWHKWRNHDFSRGYGENRIQKSFYWVSSHKGNKGNGVAVELVLQALNEPEIAHELTLIFS